MSMSANQILWIGAGLSLLTAGPALAQCNIHRIGVPDFDQRRDALPNAGKKYCAPTTATDWMAYLTNHSNSAILGQPRDWQSQDEYFYVTDRIKDMGVLMGTVATGGTVPSGFWSGVLAHLNATAPGQFNVTYQFAILNSDFGPKTVYDEMVQTHLVCLHIGWYEWQTAGYYVRKGGHFVAGEYVYGACGAEPMVGYRNPYTKDSESQSEQSQFETRESGMESVTDDWMNEQTHLVEERTQWQFTTYTGDRDGFLDGIITINPVVALTKNLETGKIGETEGECMADDGSDPPTDLEAPDGQDINGLEFHPGNYVYYASTANAEGTGHLYLYDAAEHELLEVMELLRAGPMATSPIGDLYLVNSGALQQYRISSDGTPTMLGVFGLGEVEIDDLVYDDVAQEVVCVLPTSRQIARFTSDLSAVTTHAIPGASTAGGELSIAPDANGDLWIAGTDNSLMERMVEDTAGRLSIAESARAPGQSISSLQVNDLGHLVGVSNNRVFELMYDAGGDRWVADPNSVFAGLETDGLFETSRSRNSFPLEWEDPSVFYAEDEPFADSEERVWCLADLTATSDPGAEGYGLPEGIVNEADVEYFSQQYDRGNVLLCDVSGPTPGVPDGQLDGIDRAYYLELWDTGVVDCPETTSDVSPGLPNDLSPNGGLRQVQVGPSPFRSGTSVRFELAAVKNVALGVYDMNGRLVRNLAEGPFGQGVHVVDWDGRDTAGSDVPSGVYWIRVTLPGSEGWSERVLRVR